MKRSLRQTWLALRYNIGSLLLFEAGYRTAAFLLIIKAVKKAVDFSLKKQGFSYLTAENYMDFLSSPLSLFLLFFFLLFLLFLFFVEVFALFSSFQYSCQRQKLYAGDMLIEGIKKTVSFLKNSKASWIAGAALSVPFLCALFLIREVSYIQVLEFTARQLYKAVHPHFLLYLLIFLLLAVSLFFTFALPYCLLEKERSRKGMRERMGLLGRRWRKILPGFLALHLFILGITLFFYLAAMAGMTGVIKAFWRESAQVSAVLSYSEYIHIGLGIFAGGVQLTLSLAFLYALYTWFYIPQKETAVLQRLAGRWTWLSKVGRRRLAAVLTLLLIGLETGYLVVLAAEHDTDLDSLSSQMGITAHRGGALKAPENTLSALDYTIECGADFAEIDVQETKDGELILLHDNSFKRTAGVRKNVWDLEYPQVEKLDAGASFHARFRGERIPTLDEVLNFCQGRLDLNIEIKYNGKNKGIVNKVARTIQEHDFEEHCVVTSMNYQFLEQIKKTAPDIRTGYIMTMTYGSIARIPAADFFSVKHTYIDQKFVREAHSQGKEVHAWTVNHRGEVKRLMNIGVDNIITDDPVMARKVQNQESGEGTGFFELLEYALRI